jgi:NhaP-type Na+/H+ or K+/H+ antiporter
MLDATGILAEVGAGAASPGEQIRPRTPKRIKTIRATNWRKLAAIIRYSIFIILFQNLPGATFNRF